MTELNLTALRANRHRGPIVISVTLGLGIVTLLPLVDDYYAGKTEKKECIEDLRVARQEEADLDTLTRQVGDLTTRLNDIKQKTVSKSSVHAYRSQLVDLVRLTGCQLRRLTVGVSQARPWCKGDDPLNEKPAKVTRENTTNLVLERQPVVMSVSGSMTSLKALLKEIREDRPLMHVKSMELHPLGSQRKQVILDLELWFFDLNALSAAAT
ncbi:MAG: hypothetical protein JW829_03570 [Pirellulales bacterium]|nr:hypothetical protein [Pirellulales bacterium]